MASSADPPEPKPQPEPAISLDEAREAEQGATADAAKALLGSGIPVAKTHTNVGQTLITVTGDRAKIVLSEAADKLSKRRDWNGPLGLFVGLLMSLLTANFKAVFGVSAEAVKGVVITLTILAGLWTLVSVIRALTTPTKSKVIDQTLEDLKHQGSA